jgi:hypothetical protein
MADSTDVKTRLPTRVDLSAHAQAVVQTATAWLIDQGLEGHDLPDVVCGLGHRLRQLQLQVDRLGCAIVTLHPQITNEEIVWDAESDEARTTLHTPAMMEISANIAAADLVTTPIDRFLQ